MATHVQGNSNTGSETITLNGITAGNLIVLNFAWDGYGTVTGVSDGTSSLTGLTKYSFPGADNIQCWYLLSANGGNKTFTVTTSGNIESQVLFVSEFNASGAWSFDVENGANGFNTAPDTGNISTTGTDEVVICGNKLAQIGATLSNPLINAVTPTEPAYSPAGTYHHLFYRLLTATFSNGSASGTYSTNTYWVWNLTGFKAAAAGGGPDISQTWIHGVG